MLSVPPLYCKMPRFFYNIFIFVLALKNTQCIAQHANSAGVFLNASDFTSKHISYSKVEGKRYHFRTYQFLNTSYIKITIGDSVHKLYKNTIYGYRTKDNICYRFYKNDTYEIINPTETILLYSKTYLTGYKSYVATSYYFSLTANSEIFPLSIYNLKLASTGDTLFHDQLDAHFKKDEDLLKYDAFYNMYELNKIYQHSKK